MKRPDTVAIFAPVKASTKDTAAKVLRFVIDELKGDLASYYYARVTYEAGKDVYRFREETLHLHNQEELFRSIDRDGNSMWCMVVDLGFAPAEIYAAVFADVRKPSETTLVLTIDPQITRWLETEVSTRVPFVMFLARIAQAIGSTWFVSGPHIDKWKPLDISQPLNYADFGGPYVVGWRADAPEESKLIADFNMQQHNIFMTTIKYKFEDFFPDVD